MNKKNKIVISLIFVVNYIAVLIGRPHMFVFTVYSIGLIYLLWAPKELLIGEHKSIKEFIKAHYVKEEVKK